MPSTIEPHTTKPRAIELDPALQAARLSVAQIPVIDVSPLRGGAGAGEMVAAIGKACREIGFFYAVNHGCRKAGLTRFMRRRSGFSSCPWRRRRRSRLSARRAIAAGSGWGEKFDPAKQAAGDFKEGLKIGRICPEP